jgi:D-arabinose 5-phosphate isomerase GutQ/beta-phosphoglucomutase-like phosphatase (HAD superfamily)
MNNILFKNILDYDLFIFDFDGTIMDTEKYHYNAWYNAIKEYVDIEEDIDFTMSTYEKYFHTLDHNNIKKYLEIQFNMNIDDYEYIYERKQHFYENNINTIPIQLMHGANDFLNFLIENNKKIVIVSNTSLKFLEIFKNKYPILNNIHKVYTKELFVNKKPNPECYLKIAHEYKDYKKIGFEDSLVGMHSLYQVTSITPVLIYNENYYHNDKIMHDYINIIKLENYNLIHLNAMLVNNIGSDNKLFIDKILNNNIDQLKNNFSNMNYIINNITIILKNINKNNHIYLTGMGKSGYVCKKSASTWQSLSIKSSYIDLPNLPHGDFGIFNDNDILILISNSGNTMEIIYILNYIKTKLNKKITTISIVANKDSKMEKLSDFTYILNNIVEADLINMTPSTSSLIFMALLDGIAINLKKDIKKDEFKLYHPAGSLGQK